MTKFKFINDQGREVALPDIGSFVTAVADGLILDETLVFEESTGVWRPASGLDSFQAAKSALGRTDAPDGPRREPPRPKEEGRSLDNRPPPPSPAQVSADSEDYAGNARREHHRPSDTRNRSRADDLGRGGPETPDRAVRREIRSAVRPSDTRAKVCHRCTAWNRAHARKCFACDESLEDVWPVEVTPSNATGPARGDSPRNSGESGFAQHGWLGKVFVVLTYGGAVFLAIAAVTSCVVIAEGGDVGAATVAGGIFLLLSAANAGLAYGVSNFRRWGYWLAVILIYLGIFAAFLNVLFGDTGVERIGSFVVGIIYVMFAGYFYDTRAIFKRT